jgi:hypothetical protein
MIGLEEQLEKQERELEFANRVTIHISCIVISIFKLVKETREYLDGERSL